MANPLQVSTAASSARAASASASGFPATCPTDDQKYITDTNGVTYQVRCQTDPGTNTGGTGSAQAPNGFNDCFLICDTATLSDGGRCTGFTYVGGANGVGAGNCYMKGGTTYSINTAGSNTYVGGLRVVAGSGSSTSSAAVSTTRIGTGTPSGFPATCPTDNLKNITDNYGVPYQVRCQTDISPVGGTGGTAAGTATTSFNDCFLICDTTPLNNGAQCTGFTYVGNPNGAGGGTCYLKGGATYTTSTPNDNNILAGIRLVDPGAVQSSSSALAIITTTTRTTTTTTTTSSTTSSGVYTPSAAVWPCPDYEGEYRAWPDNQSRGYTFACSAIAFPSTTFAQQPAPNNWNDCIIQCNNLAGSGCTGFWYSGGVNGQGAGTCYFINLNNGGFLLTNNTNVAGRLGTYFDTYRATTTTTSTTTATTSSSSLASSVQTLTLTTVSFATVTTTSSYAITTTAISTQVQTVTTSYPVTQTQVSTAPGEYRAVAPRREAFRHSIQDFLTISQARR